MDLGFVSAQHLENLKIDKPEKCPGAERTMPLSEGMGATGVSSALRTCRIGKSVIKI
jgi:hypothetical protein